MGKVKVLQYLFTVSIPSSEHHKFFTQDSSAQAQTQTILVLTPTHTVNMITFIFTAGDCNFLS